MADLIRQFLGDRTDRRAEIARAIVEQVVQDFCSLTQDAPEEEGPVAVWPAELDAIVRRVLTQFGVS